MTEPAARRPVRVALVNDYELVVRGIEHFFDSYRDRIEVVELVADAPVDKRVDVALYDTFGHGSPRHADIGELLGNPRVDKVVAYTWVLDAKTVAQTLEAGVHGYLSKSSTAAEMTDALGRIHAGERVVSPIPDEKEPIIGGEWPGRSEGLTVREAEVVSLIAQGYSNLEIAARAHLSINSVKSYIRNAYRKMGVARRSQAVAWALDHGFVSRPARLVARR